jgi:hypothetical protein
MSFGMSSRLEYVLFFAAAARDSTRVSRHTVDFMACLQSGRLGRAKVSCCSLARECVIPLIGGCQQKRVLALPRDHSAYFPFGPTLRMSQPVTARSAARPSILEPPSQTVVSFPPPELRCSFRSENACSWRYGPMEPLAWSLISVAVQSKPTRWRRS